MANVKKFRSPVRIHTRVEESDLVEITKITENRTEFINEAIREKLERGKK